MEEDKAMITDETHKEQPMDPMELELKRLQEEENKLKELQNSLHQEEEERVEDKEDVDARSVYVGNVEYAATPEALEKYFMPAGAINRVNIMLNKITGQPKGFAYIEFAEPAMVAEALVFNGTEFMGRELKVLPKRTNIPGFSRGRGRGRGRGGFRGRGSFRGRGFYRGRGGYTPY